MSRIFAIRRAAYSTALTPWGASEEWQVLPCTVTRNARWPLCPITTPISVGSPTKQAAGFTLARSRRAIMLRTPTQPTSSSYESARWIGRASRAASMSGTAARQQASKPFMSAAPRP
jgi:hypothetical protein